MDKELYVDLCDAVKKQKLNSKLGQLLNRALDRIEDLEVDLKRTRQKSANRHRALSDMNIRHRGMAIYRKLEKLNDFLDKVAVYGGNGEAINPPTINPADDNAMDPCGVTSEVVMPEDKVQGAELSRGVSGSSEADRIAMAESELAKTMPAQDNPDDDFICPVCRNPVGAHTKKCNNMNCSNYGNRACQAC